MYVSQREHYTQAEPRFAYSPHLKCHKHHSFVGYISFLLLQRNEQQAILRSLRINLIETIRVHCRSISVDCASMNSEALTCFKAAVDEIFTRWTGLKLAVEHMGGRNGQQVS